MVGRAGFRDKGGCGVTSANAAPAVPAPASLAPANAALANLAAHGYLAINGEPAGDGDATTTYIPVVVAGQGAATQVDELLDAAGSGSFAGQRADRILLLIPTEQANLETLQHLSNGIVAHGPAAQPGSDLDHAVEYAGQLADLALSHSNGPGIYGPHDLLVEQFTYAAPQLAKALRNRVADTLAARDPSGILTGTLRTYLACGSVPETARLELVHANTVSYRLARVRELLGLDPRVPQQAAVLVLGLGAGPTPDVPKARNPATPYPDERQTR
ncbi:MAG: hypothetical protein QOC82_2917 [Frankiaceae bacterium]|nr:hypothetical protein [Frankiaceae bacterium]